MKKKLTYFSLLFLSILGFSQTVPIITEFRLKFANEKIDFRYRPIFYFQNNTNMRRELFLGYTFNENTKLFSYTRYNDYQKKLYTGLRFDHKIVLNKLSLNNQFRYLNNLQDPSNDVFIYIPDLFYSFPKGIKAGLRGFITYSNGTGSFVNKKAYIGPALIVNRGPLIFFTTFLPDQRANSIDYLMMFLFILKLN